MINVVMIAQLVLSYILLLMPLMKLTLFVKTHVHMDTGVTLLYLQKSVLFVTNLVVLVTIKAILIVLLVHSELIS
jgi:hypothetical protein